MSLTEEERKAIVKYRLEKANTAIEDVRLVAEIHRWSAAANRLYYAIYYAATALLINDGHSTRSHSGMITLIGQHYVSTGLLTKEEGRLVKRMFDLRQEADYDDFIDADEDDINLYYPQVKALIEKIVALIK